MTQVMRPLSGMNQIEEDELKCSKCSESFRKRKHLKRHLTYSNCGTEEVSRKKMFPEKENDNEGQIDEVEEAEDCENESIVAKLQEPREVLHEEQENIAEPHDNENDMDVSVLDASVDTLSDAVEAYQREKNTFEITPMDPSLEEAADSNGNMDDSILMEEEKSPDVVDLDEYDDPMVDVSSDPQVFRMQKLMMESEYFNTRKGMVKPYIPSDKTFMTIEDPSLPEGFKVFTQMRPSGKHIDKEFLTPEGFFILRSKVACAEYASLMSQVDQDNGIENVEAHDNENYIEDNVIEITSPVKRNCSDDVISLDDAPSKRLKSSPSRGPASFKAKLKAKLNKNPIGDETLEVIKYLPKGTKIKFSKNERSTPNSSQLGPAIKTGRGVTITPIGDVSSRNQPETRVQKVLKCCNRTFMTDIGLNRHKEREHVGQKLAASNNNQAKKKSFLPYLNGASIGRSQVITTPGPDGLVLKKAQEKQKCPNCSKMFLNLDTLELHQAEKHQVKCKVCTSVFPSKLEMLEHVKASHILPCKICKKVFTTQEKLSDHHENTHDNECKKCNTNFNLKGELVAHNTKMHEFPCRFCSSVLDSQESHDEHQVSVHGSCEECEDEFSWPEPGHKCYFTNNKIAPRSERVIEQRLYRGYHFFTAKE